VELQGEAYFSLAPPEKPRPEFWVHTSDGVVKVMGTQFAVYERGRGTRVVVETGKVHVAAVEAPSELDREVVLPAGHLLQFQKDGPLPQPKMVSVHPYVTWWRDEMVFESVPFKEIVQRLEETYGVEVRVSDPRLLERTLSGSIENQSLFVVTQALAKALRVSVKRNGRTVTFGR
jgi:ferric-dicitrate binding protein FerR (iron transport regulator)